MPQFRFGVLKLYFAFIFCTRMHLYDLQYHSLSCIYAILSWTSILPLAWLELTPDRPIFFKSASLGETPGLQVVMNAIIIIDSTQKCKLLSKTRTLMSSSAGNCRRWPHCLLRRLFVIPIYFIIPPNFYFSFLLPASFQLKMLPVRRYSWYEYGVTTHKKCNFCISY